MPSTMQDMGYWRSMAEAVMDGKGLDEWQIGEAATLIYSFCDGLRSEYPLMSKICDKNQDKTIGAGVAVSIDRRNSPPETSLTFSCAEKHRRQIKKRVPDPSQTELPLDATKRQPELPVDGEDGEEPGGEE